MAVGAHPLPPVFSHDALFSSIRRSDRRRTRSRFLLLAASRIRRPRRTVPGAVVRPHRAAELRRRLERGRESAATALPGSTPRSPAHARDRRRQPLGLVAVDLKVLAAPLEPKAFAACGPPNRERLHVACTSAPPAPLRRVRSSSSEPLRSGGFTVDAGRIDRTNDPLHEAFMPRPSRKASKPRAPCVRRQTERGGPQGSNEPTWRLIPVSRAWAILPLPA